MGGLPVRARIAIGAAAAALCCLALSAPLLAALAPRGVEIADLTWLEVRDAQNAGYTTVIVPTGGLEQNGPHMVIGKHDYIVRAAAERIAKKIGRTLVAPVIPYVPEGPFDPPTGHMAFPGTIGVTDEAFEAVLDGIARSLKAGGFRTICFIGDHGLSQAAQARVAARLSAEWAGQGVRVVQVASYYDASAQVARLRADGLSDDEIGQHAGIMDTAELMAVHADGVNLAAVAPGQGGSGDPRRASAELGASLLALRVDAAAAQIRAVRQR